MTDVKLISPATASKPETIVIAEFDSIEEHSGVVHLRTEESGTLCAKCGAHAFVWCDSEFRWENHPTNCFKV